jgi:hypothetical protein
MEHTLIISYDPEAEANAIAKVYRSEENTTDDIEGDFHKDLETIAQGASAIILAAHRDKFQNSGVSLKKLISIIEQTIFSPDMEAINILTEKSKQEDEQ